MRVFGVRSNQPRRSLVFLVCVMPMHLARTPEHVKFDWTPTYVLEGGPYAWTRNPDVRG